MIEYIKKNLLSLINLIILIYVLVEIERVKVIALSTEAGTELNNFKLDYVESDINKGQLDTGDCRSTLK